MPLKTSCKVALVAALPWILLGDRCISDSGTEDGTSDDGHTSPVTYVPVLEEYKNDEDLMGMPSVFSNSVTCMMPHYENVHNIMHTCSMLVSLGCM